MASTTPFFLNKINEQGILEYCKATADASLATWDMRSRLAAIDKEYYRENLTTKDGLEGRDANQKGDKKKLADIVVPIVEPQVETALAYLVSVFLTGNPIFGCVADPGNEEQAFAMEAILDENSKHGSWVRELMMFFRDGLKYNLQAVEVDWCQEKTYAPFSKPTASGNNVEQREVVWQGNKLKRIDLYNALFDLRVIPAEMHKKAEFAGYIELFSRVALKEYLQNLRNPFNVKAAMESSVGTYNRFYIPEINWDSLVRRNLMQGMDWMQWVTAGVSSSDRINYKNIYEVYTRYCRIIPSDFALNVPAKNTSQIWKIVTVNDQVVVCAERMTNAHNHLPIIFGQPIEDGLGYQTRSFAARQIPLQDTASTLWNLKLAARRRSISDRGLYNPLLVREADINSDNPSAKIPIRPAGIGRSLAEAYYPIPYEDRDGTTFASDAQQMLQFSNYVSGQNQAQQGQFVKGNKTMTEYEDVMQKSSGRQVMMAHFVENQVFVPLKEILKLNMLQYQQTGSVYSTSQQKQVQIDPVAMRNASVNFKISDGLLPAQKIVEGETLQVAFQTLASVPALQQGYNVVGVFSHMMMTRGVDLRPYEVQQKPAAPPGVPPQLAAIAGGAAA